MLDPPDWADVVDSMAAGLIDATDAVSTWAGRNLSGGKTKLVRSNAGRWLNAFGKSSLRSPWSRALAKSVGLHASAIGALVMYTEYSAEPNRTPAEAVTKTAIVFGMSEGFAFLGGLGGCAAGASTGPGDFVICPASIFGAGMLGVMLGEPVADYAIDTANEIW